MIPSISEVKQSFQTGGFARNVLNVAIGSGAATGVKVVASPILTRLYTPAEFGLFSAFLSVSAILAAIASGRYELAVVMAEDREEATLLVYLCIGLSGLTALVVSIGVFLLSGRIGNLTGLNGGLLVLIPLFVFLMSVAQAFNNWLNWRKQYSRLGVSRTARSVGTVASQLAAKLIGGGAAGLCGGRLLGEIGFMGTSVPDFYSLREKVIISSLKNRVNRLLKKYVRFPVYTLPSTLVNKVNIKVVEPLLVSLFSPSAAGFYALSMRVLDRPLSFLGNAVKEVFYRRFSESHQEDKNITLLFVNMTVAMSIIVIPPLVAIYLYAPSLIVFVFGSQWAGTAPYIRVLIPAIMIQVVVRSTGLSMYVLEKHNVVLIWTLVFLGISVGAIYIGSVIWNDPVVSVTLLSATYVVMYTIHWLLNLYYTFDQDEIEGVVS